VGASLLAMAVGLLKCLWLTDRYREQARSYRGLNCCLGAGAISGVGGNWLFRFALSQGTSILMKCFCVP